MSRRNRKRRREVEALTVKEIEFAPPALRRKTLAQRIENYILFGEPDGIDAIHQLFPLPSGASREVWGDKSPHA